MTWPSPEDQETVVFDSRRDEEGLLYRAVHLTASGRLVIEGHDVGPGVESFFGTGNTEYEFTRTLQPDAVAKLRDLLGVAENAGLLAALTDRFERTNHLEQFLAEHGVEVESWSRVGS